MKSSKKRNCKKCIYKPDCRKLFNYCAFDGQIAEENPYDQIKKEIKEIKEVKVNEKSWNEIVAESTMR